VAVAVAGSTVSRAAARRFPETSAFQPQNEEIPQGSHATGAGSRATLKRYPSDDGGGATAAGGAVHDSVDMAAGHEVAELRRRLARLGHDGAEDGGESFDLQLALTLIETAHVNVLLLDPAGRVTYVNRFFEQLTGNRLAQIEGRDWIETCVPRPDRRGATVALLAIGHDVTLRQGAIESLARANAELESRVEERSRALEEANRALRAREGEQREVLDGLFAFVCICSPEGILLEVNRAPLAAAGLRREDVIGRPLWHADWWPDGSGAQARLEDVLARVAVGETVRDDFQVKGEKAVSGCC